MATSAFKSTSRRHPIGTSSPSTSSSTSKSHHRRSRSLSRFSRPIIPTETESGKLPQQRKLVNNINIRGSDFAEISLDDLAIEFFSNCSELDDDDDDDESSCRRSSNRRDCVVKSSTASFSQRRRSRSVSRNPNDVNNSVVISQRRGRSVSRNPNGVNNSVVSNRRRSVSVAPNQISDSESDRDFSRSSASQPKSRSMNNGNNWVASYQRTTASSHRRLTRSMSQAPQQRSHDGYSSQSSALTDEDLRDAHHGRNAIENTVRAAYAQKKIDHPAEDDANHGIYEAMRKELRSAVNEILIELKQPEKRKQDLSAESLLKEQQGQDGYKIVREVVPKSKNYAKAQSVSYPRKRSNERSRMSKRLDEEAEKYFEDFISNVEDTDFSSIDGERSDTSSTLLGSTTKQNGIPVEMEGVNLPWLKWDDNDGVRPTTPKTKPWDPSQDLEHCNGSNSSRGSWNPEHTPANSTNTKGNKFKENKNLRFNMGKYSDLEGTDELLFDSWRERSVIRTGGLLLCPLLKPY